MTTLSAITYVSNEARRTWILARELAKPSHDMLCLLQKVSPICVKIHKMHFVQYLAVHQHWQQSTLGAQEVLLLETLPPRMSNMCQHFYCIDH